MPRSCCQLTTYRLATSVPTCISSEALSDTAPLTGIGPQRLNQLPRPRLRVVPLAEGQLLEWVSVDTDAKHYFW